MHTEQEKLEAAIQAMAKEGWPVEYQDGAPLLLSEGNMGVACFRAGYDFATPAPAPLPSIVGAAAPTGLPEDGTWLRTNGLLYTLEHDSWRKGMSMKRNRLMVRIEGDPRSVGQDELDALSDRIYNMLAAAASIGGGGELADQWVIVCEKVGRGRPYWRPNAGGYTDSIVDAGKYSREEAERIVAGSRDESAWNVLDPLLYDTIVKDSIVRGNEIVLWRKHAALLAENARLRAAASSPVGGPTDEALELLDWIREEAGQRCDDESSPRTNHDLDMERRMTLLSICQHINRFKAGKSSTYPFYKRSQRVVQEVLLASQQPDKDLGWGLGVNNDSIHLANAIRAEFAQKLTNAFGANPAQPAPAPPVGVQTGGVGGWISVDDRLPEDRVRVCIARPLCLHSVDESNKVHIGYYENGGWYALGEDYDGDALLDQTVTHWQPLPAPPSL